MALYEIEKDNSGAPTGNYNLQAGGTLWADSPIGTILAFGGANAPSGWFLCQGQAVSRTTYSELFAIIGTAFGAGDGSTTFNLPDLREAVPKGAGLQGLNTVGAHLDSDGLAVGEFLDDRAQRHAHQMTISGGSGSNGVIGIVTGARGTDYTTGMVAQYGTGDTIRAGATTEVKSVGVNYIIKAKMVAVPSDFIDKVEEVVNKAITVKKGTWTGSIVLQKLGDAQYRDKFDIPVTFDTPMPDDNYTVVIDLYETRYTTIASTSKTAAGFHIEGANTDNNATSILTRVDWTAIRFPS